jgi:methyl-accepting chemotaxis protein
MKFYLSLKSQIILAMLSVSLSSVLVVGAIAFAQGRDAIQTRTYEQLVSLRNAKADRVESYFSSLTKQAIAMSETAQIVEALKAFNKAFLELKALNYSTAVSEKVANFYKDSFISKLKTGLAR